MTETKEEGSYVKGEQKGNKRGKYYRDCICDYRLPARAQRKALPDMRKNVSSWLLLKPATGSCLEAALSIGSSAQVALDHHRTMKNPRPSSLNKTVRAGAAFLSALP